MKTKEIRNMSLDEMKGKVAELDKELFGLRMSHATAQLENPLKIRVARRRLARLKTIINEKERGAK